METFCRMYHVDIDIISVQIYVDEFKHHLIKSRSVFWGAQLMRLGLGVRRACYVCFFVMIVLVAGFHRLACLLIT